MDFKFSDLAKPFPYEDIEWRAGATNGEKTQALALAYITSRAVMNRLDEVCGPQNWRDEYQAGPDKGVICGLSIRVGDEWITKWDGADNSNIEAVKGGLSDAFKRAAVKWGIGRYLYNLDGVWVECKTFGNTVRLTGKPTLPAWALPSSKPPAGTLPATTKKTEPGNEQTEEQAALLRAYEFETADHRKLGELTLDELKAQKAKADSVKPENRKEAYRTAVAALDLVLAARTAQSV